MNKKALLMGIIIGLVLGFTIGSLGPVVVNAGSDWLTGTVDEKINTLAGIQPGYGIMMQQIGQRYSDLYFAAKSGNWGFAEHQADEIQVILKDILMVTKPKRNEDAKKFLAASYPMILDAIKKENFPEFEKAFETLRNNCMNCHISQKVEFVKLKKPVMSPSPVLAGIK